MDQFYQFDKLCKEKTGKKERHFLGTEPFGRPLVVIDSSYQNNV
jgi:hypothetical protein